MGNPGGTASEVRAAQICGYGGNGVEGKACQRPATSRNGRCQRHAAFYSPKAPASVALRAAYEDRWNVAGTEFEKHFKRALADETILDPIQDLALMDASIGQALEKSKEFDSPEWRASVKAAFDRLKKANSSADPAAFGRAMSDLQELIERGATQAELISLVFDMVDRRSERLRRIRETEVKIATVVTMRDMTQIFARLVMLLESELAEDDFMRVVPAMREMLAGPMDMGFGGPKEPDDDEEEESPGSRDEAEDEA
jgi:hypothetical protein